MITPEEYLDAVRVASYNKERKNRSGIAYTVDRDLKQQSGPRDSTNYRWEVPKIEGITFDDWIESRVSQGDEIKVLDVGCGAAKLGLTAKKRWGNKVLYDGITAYPYYRHDPLHWLRLKMSGANVILGDAHHLKDYFHPGYDLIVSLCALQHMADPLKVLIDSYDLLKPNGYGLFAGDHTVGRIEGDYLEKLKFYESLHRFGVYSTGMAEYSMQYTFMHKIQPSFNPPFTYVIPSQEVMDRDLRCLDRVIPSIKYQLKKS